VPTLNWVARIREITSWLMQCLVICMYVDLSLAAFRPGPCQVFLSPKTDYEVSDLSLATKQIGHQSIFFVYFSLLLSWWFRTSRLWGLLVNLVCPALNVDGSSSSTCSSWNHLIQCSDQNSNVTGMLRKFCIFS